MFETVNAAFGQVQTQLLPQVAQKLGTYHGALGSQLDTAVPGLAAGLNQFPRSLTTSVELPVPREQRQQLASRPQLPVSGSHVGGDRTRRTRRRWRWAWRGGKPSQTTSKADGSQR